MSINKVRVAKGDKTIEVSNNQPDMSWERGYVEVISK